MSGKWSSTAGPRQTKQVNDALGDLRMASRTFRVVNGVHDGTTAEEAWAAKVADESARGYASTMIALFGSIENPVAVRVSEEIGGCYQWTVTRENYARIVADIGAAIPQIKAASPLKDERRQPEEEARVRAIVADNDRKREELDAQRTAAWAAILAKRPSWAQAVIVAEYHVDTSDPMSDYSGNRTDREVVIGWRSGSREDFRQLHAAARTFAETAETTFEEHRDNYSMGRGNYLSDHGWDGSGTGWVVKSRAISVQSFGGVPEDALRPHPLPIVANLAASIENGTLQRADNGAEVRPSSTGRAGYVELVFPEKPEEPIRDELKAAGFRWAKVTRCWYGPAASLPERYAGLSA